MCLKIRRKELIEIIFTNIGNSILNTFLLTYPYGHQYN